MTLGHKTSQSSTGLFVATAKIHCMGQNDRFSFYAKTIKILSKDHVA